ncbi:MAG TPA: glycosyltransferase [Blastocatellia bacterium]|nr:glycosyltransferase [Blastocatellia bacterium]
MDASVIIPTYNRIDALLQTLDALARIDYRTGAWEAVIVDDGSTDDTEQRVAQWIESSSIAVKYVKQKNAGPAAARNRAAAEASGRILILLDNDILVRPDFIRRHIETVEANPGCCIMGRVVHPPELEQTPFGRYRNALFEEFYESNGGNGIRETTALTGQNISLPTSDFRKLGGFDESFTIASSEDWELGLRLRRSGLKILYNPDIVVVHNDWAVSLERFCERQRLYSVSDVLLWRKYGDDNPRGPLVLQNSPIQWGTDPTGLIVKKAIKQVLSAGPIPTSIRGVCRVVESVAPDRRLSRRLYEIAIGIAIYRGVREGLRRYPGPEKDIRASRNLRRPEA